MANLANYDTGDDAPCRVQQGYIYTRRLQSNYGVGTLYFGVKPNGDIVGQEVSESSLRDVSRSAYEK